MTLKDIEKSIRDFRFLDKHLSNIYLLNGVQENNIHYVYDFFYNISDERLFFSIKLVNNKIKVLGRMINLSDVPSDLDTFMVDYSPLYEDGVESVEVEVDGNSLVYFEYRFPIENFVVNVLKLLECFFLVKKNGTEDEY